MKKITSIVTVTAAALFSVAAMAGEYTDKKTTDLLPGEVDISSTPAEPHDSKNANNRDNHGYLKNNVDGYSATKAEPHVPGSNDLDNHEDVVDKQS